MAAGTIAANREPLSVDRQISRMPRDPSHRVDGVLHAPEMSA